MSQNALVNKQFRATTWGPRHNILPLMVALNCSNYLIERNTPGNMTVWKYV